MCIRDRFIIYSTNNQCVKTTTTAKTKRAVPWWVWAVSYTHLLAAGESRDYVLQIEQFAWHNGEFQVDNYPTGVVNSYIKLGFGELLDQTGICLLYTSVRVTDQPVLVVAIPVDRGIHH